MIPTGLEEWGGILERETIAPSVNITGSVVIEKAMDPFGGVLNGEPLQKGSHPLLGKRVRHRVSGKLGMVKFASNAGGRVIAVIFEDESRAMCHANELEAI